MSFNLDEDVIYHILDVLQEPEPSHDSRACPTVLPTCYVNRSFNALATAILYSSLDLTGRSSRRPLSLLVRTLDARADLAERVRGLKILASADGVLELLPELLRSCVNLERVKFYGLANVYLRECLDAIINAGRASTIHTLSLSTHDPNPSAQPSQSRLTVAYISRRLAQFPNLRHLKLVDFMTKPCDWDVLTYRLTSLTLVNSLLGLRNFQNLCGPSQYLHKLHITEAETPSLQDFILALQEDSEWAASLKHLVITSRLELPPSTLHQIFMLPKLEILEYRGPVERTLEMSANPSGVVRKVWVRSDSARREVYGAFKSSEGPIWRLEEGTMGCSLTRN
ncbi:hypothetical protein P7C70_g1007, partial [Phenoliferia sp. Uapishka_3]